MGSTRPRRARSRTGHARSWHQPSCLLALDLAVKLALFALLIYAAARQDLPQFHGKSLTGRAIAYPIAALIVPVTWWVLSRRRAIRYPFVVDILIAGQLVMGAAIDRWGLLGQKEIDLHWPRLLGLALLAVGAALSLVKT